MAIVEERLKMVVDEAVEGGDEIASAYLNAVVTDFDDIDKVNEFKALEYFSFHKVVCVGLCVKERVSRDWSRMGSSAYGFLRSEQRSEKQCWQTRAVAPERCWKKRKKRKVGIVVNFTPMCKSICFLLFPRSLMQEHRVNFWF
ncbi:hypothetical protein SUGI_1165900 [Cryptomeria japonica]|nr:hypothetical protein SUGI_1165900 [Cryptomeria japonica]